VTQKRKLYSNEAMMIEVAAMLIAVAYPGFAPDLSAAKPISGRME
jgi:hypothetical protein